RKLAGVAEGRKAGEGTRPAYREWDVRSYRVPDSMAERTVADVERSFAPARVFVQRIRRGAQLLDAAPDTLLHRNDVAVFGARRHVLLAQGSPFGVEVEDEELLDFPMAALDVVVTRRELADKTLAEVAEERGRGVVLLKLVR